MITEQMQQCLDDTRQRFHARCIACGSLNGHTPRLRFVPAAEGGVEASFQPNIYF